MAQLGTMAGGDNGPGAKFAGGQHTHTSPVSLDGKVAVLYSMLAFCKALSSLPSDLARLIFQQMLNMVCHNSHSISDHFFLGSFSV